MSEISREWNGAKWWKFDFHTHTPASEDFGKGPDKEQLRKATPREWLLAFMRAGVDCVAVTDHNHGKWIDPLQMALQQLDEERPEGWHPLVLFPGVEIATNNGGTHVLAILDPTASTADILRLLERCGYRGRMGALDEVTNSTTLEVIEQIRSAGIAIPAHVTGPKGLFNAINGPTLARILESDAVAAIEVADTTIPLPPANTSRRHPWTTVAGSDSHHLCGESGSRYPGSHFTWVKMGQPSLEGLRLALLDGAPLSIRRFDEVVGDPNQHAPAVLEAFEVSEARFMGRSAPLRFQLNPWLNAIIGGRGTGKSTFVEFLRVVMRRSGEIPEALQDDLAKYERVNGIRSDDGLLTNTTELAAIFRKDGARYRIRWSPSGNVPSIEEQQGDGSWIEAVGEIPLRFPVRILSQKQTYQLANEPGGLLKIIDDAAEVDRREWEENWRDEKNRFLSLCAQAREIESGLADETRLQGELADVQRKLAVYEQAGHAEVLREFQLRRRQERSIAHWEEGWERIGDRLREVVDEIAMGPTESWSLPEATLETEDLLRHVEGVHADIEQIRENLNKIAEGADRLVADWHAKRDASAWKAAVDRAEARYQALNQQLAAEGAGDDPSAYGQLVQSRQSIEQRLRDLDGRRSQVLSVRAQANESLERLLELRRNLSQRRTAFVERVLAENPYVRIDLVPYGAREQVESQVRTLLGCEDRRFSKDLGDPNTGDSLLGALYPDGATETEIEQACLRFKQRLREIAAAPSLAQVNDRRFATHVAGLAPETFDRLDAWMPTDSVEVHYRAPGNGNKKFRPIREGSPGQKTAALLAFLLSYGSEPLILDQPEDDLDNHLIYDLIVQQLRSAKPTRQVIVVTHNPNIVVNGDAELVIALEARGGETRIEAQGSLQEERVRSTICTVMEGGTDAFDLRYRRIRGDAP